MSSYDDLQKVVIKKTLFLALGAACLCLVLDQKAAAKGVALGSLFSVLDFKLMAIFLPRRVLRGGRYAAIAGQIPRFLLMSIPIVLAIKLPSINLAATVLGLLLVKAAIFCHFFVGKSRSASAGAQRNNCCSSREIE
ncbi:MAG: ATP synthase subunit I [Deltaproteobacteria bacterium]|nr:ATP synthase subunit I [Deltaproteobacteria bacterium]MBW2070946.1 ATP synthase subunit I [Deltaproteobacteria bacterium]